MIGLKAYTSPKHFTGVSMATRAFERSSGSLLLRLCLPAFLFLCWPIMQRAQQTGSSQANRDRAGIGADVGSEGNKVTQGKKLSGLSVVTKAG